MNRGFLIAFMFVLLVPACGGAKRSEWENIDYSGVYRAYQGRENDSRYVPPKNSNCLEDDLMTCQ